MRTQTMSDLYSANSALERAITELCNQGGNVNDLDGLVLLDQIAAAIIAVKKQTLRAEKKRAEEDEGLRRLSGADAALICVTASQVAAMDSILDCVFAKSNEVTIKETMWTNQRT